MDTARLSEIATSLVVPGKGILAADESTGTITKKFQKYSLVPSEDQFRAFRHMLFTTPGIEQAISGVILYESTLRQKTDTGMPFGSYLLSRGIIPGIKVDQGLDKVGEIESITKGIDTLEARLPEYVSYGMQFAKWRAVFVIGPNTPSEGIIQKNSELLAQYALSCQNAGLVPIVEPEVLMDGDHDTDQCEAVTRRVLTIVFEQLNMAGVYIPGMLLKPNMIIPGKQCADQVSSETIADRTIAVIRDTVPPDVPGIVFLSGGQSSVEASDNLTAINKHKNVLETKGIHCPCEFSFSFGRALQDDALHVWAGDTKNVQKAQNVFLEWVKKNGSARYGKDT